MAITIDSGTGIINVPQADLTLVSGTLYELDTDWFRLQVKALEASENGMPFEDAHRHTTQVAVAGVTYARVVEILSPFSVQFEDGSYSVRLAGSNNNIFDVENGILVQNLVQVIANNSAGLIVVASGSGLSAAQDAKLTAINAKTQPLTFTKANEVDANVQSVNDEEIVGDGSTTPFNVP